MKRIIITLVMAILSFTTLSAQNFAEGTSQFKSQVGLLSSYSSVKIPPISLSYDYCVVDFEDAGSIGVGGLLGFQAAGDKSITVSEISIGATGSYHFTIPTVPELELYSGLIITYNIISTDISYSWLDDFYKDSGFDCDYYIGAHYFFSDKMGASLQFGGLATINAGLVFKL